jgi:hypothetical protein
MTLHLLAAGFALLMLVRHLPGALALFSPGASPDERRRAVPRLGAAAVALFLLVASLLLAARPR